MTSSKLSKFTQEELESLSLWSIPGVDGDDEEEPEEEEEVQVPMVTVEEIEAIQKNAYDEGFAKGQADGFQQGQKEGKQQGYQEGLEQGRKKGYDENQHLLQQQAAAFVKLMGTLSEPLKELDQQVENELVRLVIAIATKLYKRELKTDPARVVAAIRDGVSVLPISAQKIIVTMHPEDVELVRSILEVNNETSPWQLKEDPLITRGGCVVDSEQSHVDVTVENQLSSVIAQVLGGDRSEDEAL